MKMRSKEAKYMLLTILGVLLISFFTIMMGFTVPKSDNDHNKNKMGDPKIVQGDMEGQTDSSKIIEQMMTLTKENDGEEHLLHQGEMFQVVLPENPTTGYRWLLTKSSSPKIALIREEYFADHHDYLMVGAGGTRKIVFQVREQGEAELVLFLRRYWEPEDEFADSFTLVFNIE